MHKRDSIKLKYNSKGDNCDNVLVLPKIDSKMAKKSLSNTQIERNITALKKNILETNGNLKDLDGKIFAKLENED